jgi:xanthine dehydrogenase iron-sulfur cluster and FAD-binding subunit A
MTGNICRCGTYPRIKKAIHRAAELQAAAAKPSSASLDPVPAPDAVLAGGAE